MNVQFWGAAQTVTGSMHLVQYQDKKILLDCGLYQGRRQDAFHRNRDFPFPGSEIDAVVLSHAHIDHSGNLPSLIRSGFDGPIFSTSAARDLAVYLLLDSAKIQQSDVKYVNRKRKKQNKKPFTPLYEQEHAVTAIKKFRAIDYGESFEPVPGMKCRFHVAGHMLGAAIIELDLEQPGQSPFKLVFSGDLGRPDMPILKDPVTVPGANMIIMEATYGNRLHPQGGDAKQMLLDAALAAYQGGGKLIIPAFSVGRTQEIVYRLNLLAEDGELPRMKVFVDSPLAVNATGVFRDHDECYDDEMLERILTEEDEDPLAFDDLYYVRSAEMSKAINQLKEPCVVISASGMCESGRILHHLKNNIEKPETIILFAGYQAPHTLGRILLDQSLETVKIFGQPYEVKAQVRRLDSSSGHADQAELLAWAKGMAKEGDLKKLALVHCEMESAEPFQQLLEQAGIGPVIIPERGQTVPLA
ncbi:MAG: MBL fold metallo-hydrolase [Mariniblastus sp.]|nr:MBL fold metallo-hydrolase [Mariniblastus sp.]